MDNSEIIYDDNSGTESNKTVTEEISEQTREEIIEDIIEEGKGEISEIQPPVPTQKHKKKRPIWIVLKAVCAFILCLALVIAFIPNVRNFVFKSVFPTEIYYCTVERMNINSLKAFPLNDMTVTVSGQSLVDGLNNLELQTFAYKAPVNQNDITKDMDLYFKTVSSFKNYAEMSHEGNISRLTLNFTDEQLAKLSEAFKDTYFEFDAGSMTGAETLMTVIVDGKGRIIGREIDTPDLKLEYKSSEKEITFKLMRGDVKTEIKISADDNFTSGTAVFNETGGSENRSISVIFENLNFNDGIRGDFTVLPDSVSSVGKKISVSGKNNDIKISAILFSSDTDLIEYNISAKSGISDEFVYDSTENLAESIKNTLDYYHIDDSESDLPDEIEKEAEEPVLPCQSSYDFTMSRLKIGKEYFGLPVPLEKLPDEFKLENVTIAPFSKKDFENFDRSIKITLENYSGEPVNAMKCDVSELSVSGLRGKKIWDIKIDEIEIGTNFNTLEAKMGQPSYIEDNGERKVYFYHDCKNDIMCAFLIDNNVVSEIFFAVEYEKNY